MAKDEKLEIFIGRLKERFGEHLKKLILFGSKARGDDVKGSDYDVLLIFDEISLGVKEDIRDLTGEMLYEYNAVFSAFPLTKEALYRKRYSPFIINAQREGVLL